MRRAADGSVHGGLYIEMKRTKGSSLSDDQKLWIRHLREAGYAVAVCKGVEVAWNCLMAYLSLAAVAL